MKSKVFCDNCGHEFHIMLKEQKQIINGEMIVRTYLQCPHCLSSFIVCYDNHRTLVMKKQIRRQTVSLQNITNEKEYERKLKRIHKLQNRLENETNILKTKYENFLEQEGN